MKEVFTFVREEVVRLGSKTIRIEHLLLGIIRDGGGSAIEVLNNLEIDPEELKIIIENTINNNINIVVEDLKSEEIIFSKQAERILKKSILERKNLLEEEKKLIQQKKILSSDDNKLKDQKLRSKVAYLQKQRNKLLKSIENET